MSILPRPYRKVAGDVLVRYACNDAPVMEVDDAAVVPYLTENAMWLLDAPVKTFSQSIVDDTIRTNAEFQSKAGLRPRIIRRDSGGCCDWCAKLAGTYDYPGVPREVYRRHANCNCTVEYDPGSGKLVQDVWSKRWTRKEESGKIERRKEVGKISSVADVKNYASLTKYLKDTYGIEIDDSVKQLNFEAVKQSLVGFESMAREFPEIGEQVKRFAITQSGVMSCRGDEIKFNPFYFSDSETLTRTCEQQSKAKWWPSNASPGSVGVHESAHALEWVLGGLNPENESYFQRAMAYNKSLEAKDIISQACKNIKKTEYGKGKKNQELIEAISGYASKNKSETLAEAFADCYANGDNANPLSKEIRRLTVEKYKAYRGR